MPPATTTPGSATGKSGRWRSRPTAACSPPRATTAGSRIWNFDGHTLTASGHVITTNGQTYVAFSPDGATLVAGSNGKLATYKTSNWTLGPTFTGVTGQVRGVAVTADSQRIVTIDGADKLYVHTLVSGGTPVTSALSVYPLSLSLEAGSSATNMVAAVGFDTGRAETLPISGSTVTPVSAFTVETSTSVNVLAAAFAPTGTLLAMGDDDGKVQFWTNPVSTTSPTGAALTFATNGNVNGVAGLSWSRDGAYLAVAAGSPFAGGSASIFAYPTRLQYASVVPTYYPASVSFSPSGSALAIGEVTCGKVMLCADCQRTSIVEVARGLDRLRFQDQRVPARDSARGEPRGLLLGQAGRVSHRDGAQTTPAVQPGFDSPTAVTAGNPEGERRNGARVAAEVDQREARGVSAIKAVGSSSRRLDPSRWSAFPASIRLRR